MASEQPTYEQAALYHAREDRRMLSRMALQAGIVSSTDLRVSTNASGLQVSVAAGDAWIRGSHSGVVRQGLYSARWDAAEVLTAAAANGTNPRVDSVIARIRDTEPAPSTAGDGANTGALEIVTGTATAGATLDNRTGAPGGSGGPALPASSLVIADLLVPATFAGPFVQATHIRDRRPHATGGSWNAVSSGSNITPAANTQTATTTQFPGMRIELGEFGMLFGQARWSVQQTTAGVIGVRVTVDGTVVWDNLQAGSVAAIYATLGMGEGTPAAPGSRLVKMDVYSSTASATFFGGGGAIWLSERIVPGAASSNAGA